MVEQTQANVNGRARLCARGIHHAFFQNDILKMENKETQQRNLPFLAITMSYEDVMLRVVAPSWDYE